MADERKRLQSLNLGSRTLDWKIDGTGDAKLDMMPMGMPDLWERNYFGSLSQGAYDDYDGTAGLTCRSQPEWDRPKRAGVES